jgi:hypothetical protein
MEGIETEAAARAYEHEPENHRIYRRRKKDLMIDLVASLVSRS